MAETEVQPDSVWILERNALLNDDGTMEVVRGEKMTVCRFKIGKEVNLPEHSHPYEQVTYVLSGRMWLCIDGTNVSLGPGDVAIIPCNAAHSARIVEAPFTSIEAFSPRRTDFTLHGESKGGTGRDCGYDTR
jgi:quercetin dioxygenase-like cupin family protein